jgi:hypothetical protein
MCITYLGKGDWATRRLLSVPENLQQPIIQDL